MKHVVVDFESYYDKEVSVTEIGLTNYVKAVDPYLVSFVSDETEFCGVPDDLPKLLNVDALAQDPDLQFWAFNSNFDQAFWEKKYPKTARPWKCGIDLAAFHQYPRNLAGIVKAVLHTELKKDVRDEMKGVQFNSLPESEQQRVLDYCLNDSLKGKQVLEKLGPMSPMEDAAAEHTRMINRRGVHIDTEKVDRDKTYLERIRLEAFKNIPWTKNGDAPLSYPVFAKWCAAHGAVPPTSLDKRDAECDAWMNKHPQLAIAIRTMRTFRGSNTKLEKLKTLLANLDDRGMMPLEILYCGARHTRRWSSKGFNVQNLDKERAFADEMSGWPEFTDQTHPDYRAEDEPGIFLREYLVPPPGCVFGIIDYSQIEPRCLNWLAGNEEMLAAMRVGFGIYEAYARAVKGWKGAPDTLKKEDPKKYAAYKAEVLGLGYGMGPDKFLAECDKSDRIMVALLTKKFGRPLTDEEAAKACLNMTAIAAKRVVNDFRKQNSKVPGLWHQLDRNIRDAVMDRDRMLSLVMPTGDRLNYFQVRSKVSGGYEGFAIRGDFTAESRQPRLWGGTLTENITQRMARDVLAEAILKLERAGFPVIFHAHDEVILALDANTAKEDFEEARRIMSEAPEWCPDLPLGAAGEIHSHYTKIL